MRGGVGGEGEKFGGGDDEDAALLAGLEGVAFLALNGEGRKEKLVILGCLCGGK